MESGSGRRPKGHTQSITDYYNASQLRADTWVHLKGVTSRLAQGQNGRGESVKLHQQATQALDLLEPAQQIDSEGGTIGIPRGKP